MKTDSRPSTGNGTNTHGRSPGASSSLGQHGDAGQQGRPQQRVSSATYFDIANTILGSAGDLDEILLAAARDGDYNKIEQLLCKRGDILVDIDYKDKRTGNTALIWAAKKGHTKIAQLLLRHGADPTLRNYEAQTALEVATGATKTMLLDSVNRATECTHRLLLQAAWQGNVEVIRRLLSTNRMLDINCQNAEGLTPLMLVARDVQLFERLSSQLNKHYNPVEVAQSLLKARADVHAMDNDGKTCLHYAAQSRAGVAEKLVETFINGGSETACLDKRQYTPIHWASHFGNTPVVTALLGGGSEVNCRGFAGLTPLHISAHNDHQVTAVTLLHHGADVTLTDDRGFTPVDLAKTRKMKTTLKEAWTEATQKKQTPELGPVRNPSRESSRLIQREPSPEKKKGEVIFDGTPANPFGSQRFSQAAKSRALQRAGKQLLQDIESGRYTPTPMLSRENTRLLGTIRNTGPAVLPQISRGCPSPTSGCPSPDSPPPGRRSSVGDELRRSLEDGRNLVGRTGPPLRGRLSKTTPLATNDTADSSSVFSARRHRRSGSDPFSSPCISDVTATLDNIINRRGRSVSIADGGSPDEGLSSSQRMTLLRTPLDRETTMCVNIPTTIPEGNSPTSSTNTITFETDARCGRHSTVPVQVMPLPPNSSQILPPTPSFINHLQYSTPEGALVRAMRDEDYSSSKEPSPRSDEEGDNKVRIGVSNPMELLRSRSLLKEEFILAESRPRDPFMHSSGSEPTSSSSSLSTASSSPRECAVSSSALGRSMYRRSDPSLLTVTLREQAVASTRYAGNGRNRKSDPSVVRLLEKSGASQTQENRAAAGRSGQAAQSVFLTEQRDVTVNSAAGKTESSANTSIQKANCVSGGVKDSKPVNSASGNNSSSGGSRIVRSQSLNTSARKPVVQQDVKPNNTPVGSASAAGLKRSQSIGNVKTGAGAQQTSDKSSAGSSCTPEAEKGAPFSGKGRMVVVRDPFQDFDNVLMKSSTDFTQPPPSSTSAGEACAQKPPSASIENAYIKENTVVSGGRSRHNSESKMSVSDVAISDVGPADECQTGAKDRGASPLSQPLQPANSVQSRTKMPASSSQAGNGDNAKSSAQKTTVATRTASQTSVSKVSSAQSKSSNSSSTATNSVQTSAVQVKPGLKLQQAGDASVNANSPSAGLKVGEKTVSTSDAAKQNSASGGKGAISNPQTVPKTSESKPAAKPAVSKAAPSVSASSTTARAAGVSQPVQPVASASSGPIRKSASTDSLTSLKLGASASGKKPGSTESGKKQPPASVPQKNLSTSARDVTARLSGASSTPRAASSNSGQQSSRGSNSSASSAIGKNSAGAKDDTKSGNSVSKTQVTQLVSSTSASSATPSAVVSSASSKSSSAATPKPSVSSTPTKVTTATVLAKAIQNFPPKAAASPRPGALKGKQSAPSTTPASKPAVSITSKSTSSVSAGQNSAAIKAAPVSASVSAAGTGLKAADQSSTTAKPAAAVSKSVPASGSSMPGPAPAQKAFETTKAGSSLSLSNLKPVTVSKTPTATNSTPASPLGDSSKAHIIKSPSDSVLARKAGSGISAMESEAESEAGIEPLVKITYGTVSPRSHALAPRKYEPPISTPVIVNPFEHLSVYQSSRDKSPGPGFSATEFGYTVGRPNKDNAANTANKGKTPVKGKPPKVAKKGKDAKRPASGSSRQASAGRRRGAKSKDSKGSESEESRPKSGKTGRARSGKRRGKKGDAQADKDAAKLSEMARKGDMALISGIGWHVATHCVDTSDVHAADEMHLESSDSEELSDVESIDDAEHLNLHLDAGRGNISLTSPRFREIKIQREGSQAAAMGGDDFPPMNLDMTQREGNILPVKPPILHHSADDENNEHCLALADLDDMHKELLLRKLTPIPEMPSLTGGNVTEAIARFDRSLRDNQLSALLEGTPRDSVPKPSSGIIINVETASKDSATHDSRKGDANTDRSIVKSNNGDSRDASARSRDGATPKRSQSMKEVGSERKERRKRERKFSESKKDEEDINDAIEEILSATNTSLSSTLKSTSSLRSASNTLTEGDHKLLMKLKSHSKESPFHAGGLSPEDDGNMTPVNDSYNSDEELVPDTNPNLLKVMHAEQFNLGAKVKAMIDAGADKQKIKDMMDVDEEAKQLIKVMNSFRHMELHAGGSHQREPLVRSESHRVAKVASAQDRVPLVRPSSAGASRAKGRFHELKKTSSGNVHRSSGAEKKEGQEADISFEEEFGAHGGFADVAQAIGGDIPLDVLANTAGSETMCSRLSGHRGSRRGSACTNDSLEDETIQWKKGNVLGKGAFGTVWCGLTSEGELIAVKQIELNTADQRKAEREYEKVQEEVELLKTLNHINIVGYLGTSFEDGTVSIFMQFVPGGSIASILARFGPLDEAVFRRYTRQIIQGVEYLHDNDVIHRDIKGGNVMLMPNGIIKLIDFGCAKRLCINLSLSQTQILKSMKGTPYWMAPEVVNESGHGKKSDIWSIGCTVFEMATRKPPWADMNPMAAIFAIGSDHRAVPHLPDKFSPEAVTFVKKCLTRNQEERPSASELLLDPFMAEKTSKK